MTPAFVRGFRWSRSGIGAGRRAEASAPSEIRPPIGFRNDTGQAGGAASGSLVETGARPLGGAVKRIADIVIASVALAALLPLMAMIAAAIYLTMGRPIIFSHKRVGFAGREFDCFKFRTMVKDSDQRLREYLASNPDAARIWRETRKLPNDPRVTPLGHFLRKSSLDELPQFLNILKGDMSCVGPRPVVREELEKYGMSKRSYLAARPGLTGLWQVSGRSNTTYGMRVCLDRVYQRRWKLILDCAIMLKTIPAVLKFRDTA
ncbi:MAG: sugar transferase [Hyphomicrobiales bacterium]|nr:sugar transferase [Hyphomicrobiales bacterium]